MGGCEEGTLVLLEPTVKYHPYYDEILTRVREAGPGTVLGGQFDWGGLLLKCNGGVQRYPQHGWQSCDECNGIRVLNCERDYLEQMRKQDVVIWRFRVEGPSLIR